MANEQAWANLNAEKERRLPTPPVGEALVWYIDCDKNRPVAAQCNAIEGPGRIWVVIHTKNGMPMHRGACLHVSHPTFEKSISALQRTNGSWDYPRHKAPVEDYAVHDAEIAKREAALRKGDEEAKKNEELFIEKAAEKAAGTKKRKLPDILPAPGSSVV